MAFCSLRAVSRQCGADVHQQSVAGWQIRQKQVCRSVAVAVLWTCEFIQMVWLRVAVAGQTVGILEGLCTWEAVSFPKVSTGTTLLFLWYRKELLR